MDLAITDGHISPYLWLSSIPLSIHHIFIQSSLDGHFGCFHALAIVTNAAMNIWVHESLQMSVFYIFGVNTMCPLK